MTFRDFELGFGWSVSTMQMLRASSLSPPALKNCAAPASREQLIASFRALRRCPVTAILGSSHGFILYGSENQCSGSLKLPRSRAAQQDATTESNSGDDPSTPRAEDGPSGNASTFCIIDGPETVQDFAKMQLQEIRDNIKSRRNKIFLLMEEIRRLRIQQRIKSAEHEITNEDENEMPNFPSFIPFLPPLTSATLRQYYVFCFGLVAGVILFGGLLAPILELKMGLGGTSYKDFIRSMHLPPQLSEVDPIVASFSGGAVGVISSLMVVEVNNVKQQEGKRCKYCIGTGYLACARCSGTGSLVALEPVSIFSSSDSRLRAPTTQRCPNCSGSARVMCPTCLCTGMAMASEHDPRIDPFD